MTIQQHSNIAITIIMKHPTHPYRELSPLPSTLKPAVRIVPGSSAEFTSAFLCLCFLCCNHGWLLRQHWLPTPFLVTRQELRLCGIGPHTPGLLLAAFKTLSLYDWWTPIGKSDREFGSETRARKPDRKVGSESQSEIRIFQVVKMASCICRS